MYERQIEFLPIDIYLSDATKFLIQDGKIRPPLASIPGLGEVAAVGIQKAAQEEKGKFMSIDDLSIKAKIGKATIELLEKFGCLKDMNKSNQMSLFG
jgi:DNA polymerase-3 subunit alpha (Gram-positive type)